MVTGSCLCGKVTYQITGEIGDIVHCHCISCRKAHGAAFSSVASVEEADFSLTGEKFINSYQSSPGKFRYFCTHCATQIYAKRETASHIILRLGSLDDDPKSLEKSHIWLSQKASWFNLDEELPRYQEFE